MKQWSLGWAILLTGALVMTATSAVAQTPDSTLYTVTEVMKVAGTTTPHRIAAGALAGTARLDTPFCPEKLAPKLPVGATECWVVATGADDINLTNGQGTLAALINPVTTGDNPFAAPMLELDRMIVNGQIDFSPALGGLPYGTVTGRVNFRYHFTGVFLQPFLGSVVVDADGTTLRQLLCPLTTTPSNALGGPDFAWLEIANGAPTGRCIDIQPTQLSLGFPTLRFDLFFQ